MVDTLIRWQDVNPKDAERLDLRTDYRYTAPLNEEGQRCPWPWEPQQLIGVPLGQYHCRYCGAMVVAGVEHLDYTDEDTPLEELLHNGPIEF